MYKCKCNFIPNQGLKNKKHVRVIITTGMVRVLQGSGANPCKKLSRPQSMCWLGAIPAGRTCIKFP